MHRWLPKCGARSGSAPALTAPTGLAGTPSLFRPRWTSFDPFRWNAPCRRPGRPQVTKHGGRPTTPTSRFASASTASVRAKSPGTSRSRSTQSQARSGSLPRGVRRLRYDRVTPAPPAGVLSGSSKEINYSAAGDPVLANVPMRTTDQPEGPHRATWRSTLRCPLGEIANREVSRINSDQGIHSLAVVSPGPPSWPPAGRP
jgi:hypothetical protein